VIEDNLKRKCFICKNELDPVTFEKVERVVEEIKEEKIKKKEKKEK